ncbi:MAG: ABC transporter ATP-binding protein [Eubacterium sp.]|nr:ABC transporter ATP-binding protein [Eubacterium sp.]
MENKNKISKSDIPVLKWIYTVCKKQTPWLVAMVILNVVHGTMAVFFANYSKKVIDGATVSKDINTVIKYAIALLGVIMIQMVLYVSKNAISEYSKGRLTILLQKHMLKTILKKNYSSVTKYHSGELQNRMFNDASVVTDGFMTIIPNTVFFITKLVSAFIYLVIIDRFFALVFLAGGLFVFSVTRLFRKTIKRLHKKVQETEGKTRSFVQEALTNLLVFKAFSAENKVEEETGELQEINFKAKMKRRNFSILANTGLNVTFSIGSVFAVAFGAWSIIFKGTTYGTVTAMIQLVNQIQAPFASLSNVVPQYFTLIASAERLMELDSIDDEFDLNKKAIDKYEVYNSLKRIEFENISFKYDRDIILDNTSFTMNKGDFVAITGISGIGKSTLLKLLLGVYEAQTGEIRIVTENESLYADKNTRPLFSYVPQGNMLISGTIRENLTFISPASEDEIQKAVDISCARSFIDELPDGLDTLIGEKGLGLSEGQVQRLAIARSILSGAPIILLDEATSALDENTEKQFLSNLRKLENVSCIIVSHKLAALEICNKHIRIIDGKITEV